MATPLKLHDASSDGDLKQITTSEENYFAYGILERIDLFINDFYSKSGVKLTPKKTNITKQKKLNSLSKNEKKIIEKFCEEDINLYQKLKNQIERNEKRSSSF